MTGYRRFDKIRSENKCEARRTNGDACNTARTQKVTVVGIDDPSESREMYLCAPHRKLAQNVFVSERVSRKGWRLERKGI